jgi:hypothetical protein
VTGLWASCIERRLALGTRALTVIFERFVLQAMSPRISAPFQGGVKPFNCKRLSASCHAGAVARSAPEQSCKTRH